MKFADMKTSTRVAMALGFVTLLLAGLMAVAITRMESLTREIDGMASSRVPKVTLSGRAVETLLQSARQMRNTLVLDDENEIKSEAADIARNEAQIGEIIGQLEKLITGDTEVALFQSVQKARAAYQPLEADFLARVKKGDYSTAKDLMIAKVRQAQAAYVDSLSALIEFQTSTITSEARAAHVSQQRATAFMIGLTVGAILFSILASILIISGVRKRFGESGYAAKAARAIASGDLTQRVQAGKGDDAVILHAMGKMRDDLVHAVSAIRASAESVGVASRQIATGNTNLASRTEEQASSLEETAASMEELASTVKQSAENAGQADKLAQGASQRAEQGGVEVQRVVATMGEISESAARISDITSVIDGIAFQTNILALNAAVEAARAGEHGRGFAVVATEVRALAHRASDAAKEIKGLIGGSLTRVDAGKKQVESAGNTIQALVGDVKEVSSLMRAIAEASAEQARGVQQVNKTVTEMDRVVQQNASEVQESAAAAEAMRRQAETLLAAVSAFRVSEDDAAAHGAATAVEHERVRPPGRSLAPTRQRLAAATAAAASEEDWEQF